MHVNSSSELHFSSLCVHAGELNDTQFKGAISPLFMATSYAYEEVEVKRYPRYFNTPNQVALAQKMAALEQKEAAMLFGSGMGAVANALLSFLKSGDHVVFQKQLYGGTYHFVVETLPRMNISYSFATEDTPEALEACVQENTKVIYIETPSNPKMTLVDIQAVANIAKKHQLISMIDNTFASPVNQNPHELGIDVIIHSATKYLGGHSDILAGVVMASKEHIQQMFVTGINLGANLSDYTVWLLERSVKTLHVRVKQQNKNAKKLAKRLHENPLVASVYYPGLKSHPQYELAKKQMKGFGGMLSFELSDEVDTDVFLKKLQIIKPSMSLAGVESTILSPAKTSHSLLSKEERMSQGITDQLLRFSVGIERADDLWFDLHQAMEAAKK